MWFLEQAWLIPVIPSVGYFVILLFGKRLPLKGSEIGVGTLGASFLLACGAVYQWIQRVDTTPGAAAGRSAPWPRSGARSSRPQEKGSRPRTSCRPSSASGRGGRSAT